MKRIFAGIRNALTRDIERERELAYLNGAVSIADVERRMRSIERGQFRQYGF